VPWVDRLTLGLAAAALLAGTGRAQNAPGAPLSGPYVSLGAGLSAQQDIIRDPSASAGPLHPKWWQFDPGAAADFSLGWGFGNGLRLDFEAPIVANKVRGVEGYATPRRAGGVEMKYGGMVNLMYDFHLGLPVTPYVGIGAGGIELAHDHFNSSSPGFIFPAPLGNQVVGDFAYQGIVGFSYDLAFVPGLAMTAEYRFLGLLDPQPGFRTTDYSATGDVLATNNAHYSNDFDHTVMVGLRYALFQPPPPVQPQATAPVVPETPPPSPTRTYLVFFDWDRADLTDRARQIIAEAATASSQVKTTQIEVNGYTDLSGSAAYNKRLSVRRAESVAAELVRDGVSDDEIVMKGFGESHPLVPTAPGVREPQNRRVEVILQ
jgi:outer membrane protein OmpA-like peptidoglycan-associated protein